MDSENDVVTASDAPAVARRRVRLALRNARSAKQLTQTDVATAMGWSLSKVMRIEKGQVNISTGDLRMVLNYLDVTDPDDIQQLETDARVSRKERYTTDAEDREHFTPAMLQLFQYEVAATSICAYQNMVLPAHLQTEPYARAVTEGFTALPRRVVEARVQRRMERRALLQKPNLRYQAILDESVLMRPFGGTEVMRHQLELLLRLTAESEATIRIVPLDLGAVVTLVGPFTILTLEDFTEGVVYRESGDHDELLQTFVEVTKHEEAFSQLAQKALGEDDSRLLIERHTRGPSVR